MTTSNDDRPSKQEREWKEAEDFSCFADTFRKVIDALDRLEAGSFTGSISFLLSMLNETYRTDRPHKDLQRMNNLITSLCWVVTALIEQSEGFDGSESLLDSLRDRMRNSELPELLEQARAREIALTAGAIEEPPVLPQWAGADYCRCTQHLTGEKPQPDEGIADLYEQDRQFLLLLSEAREFSPPDAFEGFDWWVACEKSCGNSEGTVDLDRLLTRLSQMTTMFHGFLTWGDDSQQLRDRFIRFLDQYYVEFVHEAHSIFLSMEEYEGMDDLDGDAGAADAVRAEPCEPVPLSKADVEATVWSAMRVVEDSEEKGWFLGEPPADEPSADEPSADEPPEEPTE